MKIDLNKRTFQPGDTIEGLMRMTLKKPTKARAIIIRLKGEEIVRTKEHRMNGRNESRTESYTICEVKQRLGGPKEYLREEIPFKIRIPKNAMRGSGPAFGNALGGVLGVLAGRSERSEFRWYVIAELDIPNGIDVSKTEKINVNE
jgi:hypothetical protein